VLEALLTVAEKHNIQVWADYGTLLGLKRDKGVILWDYDADLGMFDVDRERLLEAVKIEQAKGTITPLLVMDEKYYDDRGCMAAYLAKNAEVGRSWTMVEFSLSVFISTPSFTTATFATLSLTSLTETLCALCRLRRCSRTTHALTTTAAKCRTCCR
jgi:hypothetical protein